MRLAEKEIHGYVIDLLDGLTVRQLFMHLHVL